MEFTAVIHHYLREVQLHERDRRMKRTAVTASLGGISPIARCPCPTHQTIRIHLRFVFPFPNHDSPSPSHFCFPLVGDGGGKASYLLSLVCEDAGNRYFLFLRFLNILCILLSISALVILSLANNAVCYIRTAQYLDILPFAVFQQVAEFQHVFWLRCIVYA